MQMFARKTLATCSVSFEANPRAAFAVLGYRSLRAIWQVTEWPRLFGQNGDDHRDRARSTSLRHSDPCGEVDVAHATRGDIDAKWVSA